MCSNLVPQMGWMTLLVVFAITVAVQVALNVAWLVCCDFGVHRSMDKIGSSAERYRVDLSGLRSD